MNKLTSDELSIETLKMCHVMESLKLHDIRTAFRILRALFDMHV